MKTNLGINFNNLNKRLTNIEYEINEEKIVQRDIAVIGMDAKIGGTETAEKFWDALCNGYDLVREFPENRCNDILEYVKESKINQAAKEKYVEKAYMNNIDTFDASFFNILPSDAILMDPAQRIFLESAYKTIEDAGYTSEKLDGTKTGVFVGYSTSNRNYLDMLEKLNTELFEKAVAGTVNSVIASRMSYYLNLRGPAVVIDTACSSALVAIHMACQSILSAESEMAIAGGIKFVLVPEKQNKEESVSISSSTGRTKTFDASADGTGAGEGVATILLKPLHKAIKDRDNIYAVIKGSAINQDGASVGITAPNSAAQEEVILQAWENGKINPETISYIEAHGTATKLGDPVEITGIERAFRRYTDKKQFCAIGSVKTNIGHLDCAAGIASMVKVILALKNKELPPNLHFYSPNSSIDFIQSPVFINDQLAKWERGITPRRCGVSSFGMSGTNCHIVLEEAPNIMNEEPSEEQLHVLALSAKSKEALQELLEQYSKYFEDTKLPLRDICYTANTGRGHFKYRFAILLRSKEEFIERYKKNGFYGEFKIVKTVSVDNGRGELTQEEQDNLTKKANILVQNSKQLEVDYYEKNLQELCSLYVQGANVKWELLYNKEAYSKVSVPTYPFQRKRFWVEKTKVFEEAIRENKTIEHPLIDTCIVSSLDLFVFYTKMSVQTHAELREHVIGTKNVLAGTVYVEMIHQAAQIVYKTDELELESLMFLVPMICEVDHYRDVHTIITKEEDSLSVCVQSKDNTETEWIRHVQARVRKVKFQEQKMMDLKHILQRTTKTIYPDYSDLSDSLVKVGPRWSTSKELHIGENEVAVCSEISEEFESEISQYMLYPSLLDAAVNGGNILNDGVHFLPFRYGKAKFYQATPRKLYSYIKRKGNASYMDEINTYDICLMKENGEVIAEIEDYAMKKVHDKELGDFQGNVNQLYYRTKWIEKAFMYSEKRLEKHQTNIVIRTPKQGGKQLFDFLKIRDSFNYVELILGNEKRIISDTQYCINAERYEDYVEFFDKFTSQGINRIWYMVPLDEYDNTDYQELQDMIQHKVKSLFLTMKVLTNSRLRTPVDFNIFTSNAVEVTGGEQEINAFGMTFSGIGKSVSLENDKLRVRNIDFDDNTELEIIYQECMTEKINFTVAYRNNIRYVEELEELEFETEDEPVNINSDGIYFITGGLGGMGLVFADYLVSQNPNVKLALINRTKFPERSVWSEASKLSDMQLQQIKAITSLEEKGATIEIIALDISNYEETRNTVNRLRQQYNKIRGVLHTAGIAGDGFLIRKEWDTFQNVLKPKIEGAWILDTVTKEDDMDFFVVFSSISAIFSAPGQADYTAANAYLDSFSYQRNKMGRKTLVIDWTGWKETGMAFKHNVNQQDGVWKFIYNKEAVECFQKLLSQTKKRAIVGEIDYSKLGEEVEQLEGMVAFSEDIHKKMSKSKLKHYEDKNLSPQNYDIVVHGKNSGGLTPVEKEIAAIWSKTLGISEVDYNDKFFEIGGDSLIATYLQKDIDKSFPNIMDITDVFAYSSIHEMSKFIESKLHKDEKTDNNKNEMENDLEALLEKLASGLIDVDDAQKMV